MKKEIHNNVKRINYQASEAEAVMIEYIQRELDNALKPDFKVTTSDALTLAVVRMYEILQESKNWEDMLPYYHNLEQTRLSRLV